MLEYRSIDDLNKLIAQNLGRFDSDLDLIVGVPRSGMLPATILALYLNLPLTDLDSYINNDPVSGGQRLDSIMRHRIPAHKESRRKVLVIDDSLYSGSAMSIAKNKISRMKGSEDNIIYAVIYIHPKQIDQVDLWFESIENRVFEWNILNHNILVNSCVDIDGILCRDPSEKENDDSFEYLNFIKNVPVLNRPSFEIGWLVTNRLEKYRNATEQWLSNNRIIYKNLVMLDLPTKEDRMAKNYNSQHKAHTYKRSDAVLFIESSHSQALGIAAISHKPVFCNETRKMLYHTSIDQLKNIDAIKRNALVRFLAWTTRPIRHFFRSINIHT